jgi:hypothetical protein
MAAEISIRSSAQRGNECKLRRTDPALHDTTKRFVESLCPDVRISQYADANYAAKRMERDPWYWLLPVPGGRVGYLVFQPKQPAVWIDEQFKMSWRINIRVSSSIYERPSVFIASLNKSDGLLRLEDAWLISGKSLLTTPFTQRWGVICDFYGESYKVDEKLQQGLRVETAEFKSLTAARNITGIPTVYAQGERAPRRLRVQFEVNSATQPKQVRSATAALKPMFVDTEESTAPVEEQPLEGQTVARAVAHEDHPDTYNLWINGVKKGYAAVQDLDLSRQLRAAAKDAKEIFVIVEWNDEFKMYEILSQK